jgi:hypothetical protein
VKLTPTQEKAVTYGGRNLQLIACAGSGKTEVVARRVVRLLTPDRPESLLPRNIIAFTFTDKAAAELKERIVTRTCELLGDMPGMAEMFVGTIHAFCLELQNGAWLIVEIKGQVGDAAIKKAAAERWCQAVNNDGRYGKWDYRLCFGAEELKSVCDAIS